MTRTIRRNNQYNVKGQPDNKAVAVDLEQSAKLFPAGDLNKSWDMYQLYLKERNTCDKIRLTCTVNPLYTNVLFNPVTEVIYEEGSPSAVSLNYNPGLVVTGTSVNRSGNTWTAYGAVRDTELSNPVNGFEYKPGLDIFNNHILRSRTFRQVNKANTPTPYFNTIDDIMRDKYGKSLNGIVDQIVAPGVSTPLLTTANTFMYNPENCRTFFESIRDNLHEEKGWFGFTNKTMVPQVDLINNGLLYQRVMNDTEPCTFVEMYPGPGLFSFTPRYNPYRKREEKNWNYCLTYPYKKTTNVDVIDQDTLGLRAVYYDDYPENVSDALMVYSVAKHGLKVGDKVNVYVGTALTYNNVEVVQLGDGYRDNDEYAFAVARESDYLCNHWVDLNELPAVVNQQTGEVRYYEITSQNGLMYTGICYNYNPSMPWKVSVSGVTNNIFRPIESHLPVVRGHKVPYRLDDATGAHVHGIQALSFKKVVDGVECEYYTQLLHRIPNWKYATGPVTDDMKRSANGPETSMECEFASQNTKLAYSNTIYSDEKSQIVFTDDIDLSGLVDHFGRPLTEINLTIVKNNAGYRDWYATKVSEADPTYHPVLKKGDTVPETVEYSHCFGPLCVAYANSEESDYYEVDIESIRLAHGNYNAFLATVGPDKRIRGNEVNRDDWEFIGDLCCFSPGEYRETHLSPCCMRFNTAQRDLTSNESLTYGYYSGVTYDEFWPEPIVGNTLTGTTRPRTIARGNSSNEGYYYQMHQPIQVHGYSNELEQQYPKVCTVKDIQDWYNAYLFVRTNETNYYQTGDLIKMAFATASGATQYFDAMVNGEAVYSGETYTQLMILSGYTEAITAYTTNENIRLLKPDITIPYYATFLRDGSCRYVWREFLKNGANNIDNPREWVFTNGCFYVEHDFNFYLHRQDPKQERLGTKLGDSLGDPEGKVQEASVDNSYYGADEISCSFSTTSDLL